MKTFEITYWTEDPAEEYSKKIRAAKSLEELREVCRFYAPCAPDALRCAELMEEHDFLQFKRERPMMKRKQSQKKIEELVKRWGDLVMPWKMSKASLVASQFVVPWGTAFIRIDETNTW